MGAIVMTGATSGFGAVAADHLRRGRSQPLIVGSRSGGTHRVDLASLASVREFAGTVRERLGSDQLDALVLNAGVIRADDAGRSADGYETTFAVNHLAHYLLLRLLEPVLAPGARVVVTTSGTHDPATGASLEPPRHANAALLADPGRDPQRHAKPRRAGQHAYTASKLCSVLMVRAFAEQSEVRARGITVVAYDPGQVFGTGMARDLPAHLRLAWLILGTPVGAPLRWFNGALATPAAAAQGLADLASGAIVPPTSGAYAALRRGTLGWSEPSELARDRDLASRLWADSARLVGLHP